MFQPNSFQGNAFQVPAISTYSTERWASYGLSYSRPETIAFGQHHIVNRLVSQLKEKGKDHYEATKIARKHLGKSGIVNKDGSLTDKGIERSKMTPAQRAFQRAGVSPEDGWYFNSSTNKVERIQ